MVFVFPQSLTFSKGAGSTRLQLVQEALEGVPQSEEDRLEVLKWAITLVRGKEEDQEENPNPENHDNNSQELQWSGAKEPNNQLSDCNRSTAPSRGIARTWVQARPGHQWRSRASSHFAHHPSQPLPRVIKV